MISFPNDSFTQFTFNYFIVTIQVYFTFLLTFEEYCSGLCSQIYVIECWRVERGGKLSGIQSYANKHKVLNINNL